MPAARSQAQQRYDLRIVAAFYDDIQPTRHDSWERRDALLAIPADSVRVQIVGTTGAGKTTLVRQMIGTNPKTERFPSTSAAKTTVSDIEIIAADGPFSAVVTFLSEFETQQYIEDNVAAAVMAACMHDRPADIERKLLDHREQRFRLSYMLGKTSAVAVNEEDESADADEEPVEDEVEVSIEERQAFVTRLRMHLADVVALAQTTREHLAEQLDFSEEGASKHDAEAFQELIEDDIYDRPAFAELVDRMLDDVRQRFVYLTNGELTLDERGWPATWLWTSDDRAAFIAAINRFSSNYAPNFGKLLTPLVNGIRVQGPFRPEWGDGRIPPLVLMDGEGLGHTPESTASLSTAVTRRFELAHFILLVDNGAAPMQAAPGAVLRSAVVQGHIEKLAIAFSHVDLVRGDNLLTTADKRTHILASLENQIAVVCRDLGRGAETMVRRSLEQRTFFLANIQKQAIMGPSQEEFRRLLHTMLGSQDVVVVAPQPEVISALERALAPVEHGIRLPEYDSARLVWYVQKAVQEFRELWQARTGLSYRPAVTKEHWARIKALTRYIGLLGYDEYHSLRPAADRIENLATQIYIFLRNECRWVPNGDVDEQGVAAVAREVAYQLHRVITNMLLQDHRLAWQEAYWHRGTGSTTTRARDIDAIYRTVAPMLSDLAQIREIPLERDVRLIVQEALMSYSERQQSRLLVAG